VKFYEVDPCGDSRWERFLQRHPDASIFHTSAWLEALRRTYSYQPVVFSTSASGKELESGQVFCRINSWLTGRRLVSVPFSDHAALLINQAYDLDSLLLHLQNRVEERDCKYVEIRPLVTDRSYAPFRESGMYYLHRLLLDSDLSSIFRKFHKSCVQRKIRRAIRERLEYTEGRSERLIQHFHQLLRLTQRRHRLPPQPISWFRNLADCLGEDLKVRVASKDGRPIAAMITLSYKQTMIYKYGCSDARFHNLGGMSVLFWKTIQEAKSRGFKELDMGRCDLDSPGLGKFKEHWGAERMILKYQRYPASALSRSTQWELMAAKKIFSLTPTNTLATVGRLLYRHVG